MGVVSCGGAILWAWLSRVGGGGGGGHSVGVVYCGAAILWAGSTCGGGRPSLWAWPHLGGATLWAWFMWGGHLVGGAIL